MPGTDERAEVHRIIFEELCRGDVRAESRTRVLGVIGELAARGAQGVVLGCTELELLVDPDHRGPGAAPVPLLPTARLHALAAVDAALDAV